MRAESRLTVKLVEFFLNRRLSSSIRSSPVQSWSTWRYFRRSNCVLEHSWVPVSLRMEYTKDFTQNVASVCSLNQLAVERQSQSTDFGKLELTDFKRLVHFQNKNALIIYLSPIWTFNPLRGTSDYGWRMSNMFDILG